MTPRRTQTRAAGFSLIEILIAMAILSIAIIALANLFLISIKKNARSTEQTLVHQIAQDKVEELFSLDRITFETTYPSVSLPATASETIVVVTGYEKRAGVRTEKKKRYTRTITVDTGPEDNTWVIRVVVVGAEIKSAGGGNTTQGYFGKQLIADLAVVKVGEVGGVFTRN